MGDRGESREPIPGESPPKRRRVIDDDENSEVENEEGNNNYDKEEQDGGEDEGDEEEDEGSESEPPSPPNPRNGGPRRGINTPGKAPEAGIIKQVYVENFMCHRKFKVELCRNVNFITGQNGSGKSAILAAIQICLGAGARRTHRARNLKDLVRKDAASNAPNCAKIQVSILNKGSDAYEPEIYGDTIIVERTISLKGGFNGFKLYNSNMEEKSRSKKDLCAMLDQLNIQVENPVAVLDQEEAKKFLLGKAEDKYDFFMKATELSRISYSFASTAEKLDILSMSRSKIASGLGRKEEQVQELKRKCEEHEKLAKLKLKHMQAQLAYAWAYHATVAREYDNAMETLQAYEEKARVREEKVAELEREARDPTDEEAIRRNRIEALMAECQAQAALKNDLESRLRELLAPLKRLERDQKTLQKDRADIERKLANSKKRLQEARAQILEQEGSKESEQAKRVASLQEIDNELAELEAQTNTKKQAVANALRAYEELEPHVHSARKSVQNISDKLAAIRNTLNSLKASSGDNFALFGPRVRSVYEKVEQAKRQRLFKGPVVGPIGHYVKVLPGKEAYAPVAEKAINSRTLDRFIVTNTDDRRLLQKLREQAGCGSDCGIFQIGNNPRFNIPFPDIDGVETIASVLKIEDDLVFNCLVDNCRIDQIALCKNVDESERKLYYRNEKGEDAIRGIITEVYILPDADFWTVKNGSKAFFSGDRRLKQTIGVDKTAAIRDAELEEEQATKELRDAREALAKLEHDHTNHQKDWNYAKRENAKHLEKINTLSSKRDEIRSEMEASADVSIDTSEYEQDVENLQEQLDSMDQEEDRVIREIESMIPAIDKVKAEIEECSSRNEKVLLEMTEANKTLSQFVESKSQQQSQIEKQRQKLDKCRAAIELCREKASSLKEDKDSALDSARRMTFRLELEQSRDSDSAEEPNSQRREATYEELQAIEIMQVDREPNFFLAKVNKLKEKIAAEKERRKIAKDDSAAAKEKLVRAIEDLRAQQKHLKELDEKIDELERDISDRNKRWKAMRRHLEKTTAIKFKELLSLNHYCGQVVFSHEGSKLDLLVSKENAKEAGNKDVKSLSGGERSYTTMCLLLALGENLETPFRILDEFDVFLDAPTRKLTISMLIHLAKTKMAHRQFIFITPQDLSGLNPDAQLKILRLHPPERNTVVGAPTQQTLPFSQAN